VIELSIADILKNNTTIFISQCLIGFEYSINSIPKNRREGLKMRKIVVAKLEIEIYLKSKLPGIHFQICIVLTRGYLK